jgi:hypothetical protein
MVETRSYDVVEYPDDDGEDLDRFEKRMDRMYMRCRWGGADPDGRNLYAPPNFYITIRLGDHA